MNANVEISFEKVEEKCWAENVKNFAKTILSDEDFAKNFATWDLSIVFCDDDFIHDLNKKFRGVDGATDVLSFENGTIYEDETGEKHFLAGDIVISLPFLTENAKNFQTSENDELKRLILHGILHLAGFDHETNDFQTEPMLLMQEEILKKHIEKIIID